MSDLIDRQAVIDALWKALCEYEDKTEKQFLESEKLDIEDWIQHRIFVQNMNDIDRQVVLNMPSAQPEHNLCRECACVQYYGEVDKHGNVESSWYCCNWDGRTDEEGFCHEWREK